MVVKRKEKLEKFVLEMQKHMETCIMETEDNEEIVLLSSVMLFTAKNILIAQFGVDKAKELLINKINEVNILD